MYHSDTPSHILSLASKLVQIDSTNPGHQEADFLSFLLEQLTPYHSEVTITTEEVFPGRSNLMAVLPSSAPVSNNSSIPPAMVFICHMDTVPVGNGWTRDPFDGKIEENKLYGRGACDMKSGFACAFSAFLHAAEYVKNGGRLKTTIKFIATVDEEDEMCGVEAAISSKWITENDWIMDTEPTSLAIEVAHKGRTWFHLTFEGIAAHASTPWKGADAIAAMAEALVRIRNYVSTLPTHPFMGKTTISYGTIQGGTHPYAVSDSCTTTIDLRLVPPTSTESLQKAFTQIISEVEQTIPGVHGILTLTGNKDVIEEHLDSPFLSVLKKCYMQVTDSIPDILLFPGYTDTAVIASRLKNPHCLSFGPGNLEHAHKPDEFADIAEILQCQKILQTLIETFFVSIRT